MNILSQFNNIVTKNITQNLSEYLYNMYNGFDNPYSIDSYKQFITSFDIFTSKLNIDAYIEFIRLLDDEFMNSSLRLRTYSSKGFITKSILTKFGWINFKRRRYINKFTGASFIFIDEFLGLKKYSKLDPVVIGDLCVTSSTTSYANAGRIVSNSIGTRVKFDNDINILSRATVRNNVLKASKLIKEPTKTTYKDVEVLNVMLDEKFVPSQFNESKDFMIKGCVIFEDTYLEYKNRTRLKSKHILASIDNDLLAKVLDYIYYNYDTDKLKTINFMGDGANWIKSFSLDTSFKYHKDIIIKFGLDHYHLAQAIQRIVTNKYKDEYSSKMKEYIITNKKEKFLGLCIQIIEKEPTRISTIQDNIKYILNNWKHIQTSFHDIKYKCSMESNISHVFADLFTSRPKAYSYNGLKCLLKLRLLKINGYDIKDLYFKALKEQETQIKQEQLQKKLPKQNKYTKYIHSINVDILIPSIKSALNRL